MDDAFKLANESCQRGPIQIYCEMPWALTVPALVELSRDADLVVVGCRGTGTLRGRHMGSVSSGLVYHAKCPIAITHDDVQLNTDAAWAPVLVGIDGSPQSESAIAIAFDEASRRKVGLTVLHAWSDVGVLDPIVSSPGPGWPALRAVGAKIVAECRTPTLAGAPGCPAHIASGAAAPAWSAAAIATAVRIGSTC